MLTVLKVIVLIISLCRWDMSFLENAFCRYFFFVIPFIVLLYFQLAEHRPGIPILEDAVQ